MKDKTLLVIAIITGVIGTLTLYFVSSGIEPYDTVSYSNLGKEVQVEGRLLNIRDAGTVQIMELNSSQTIKVVFFQEEDLGLRAGDKLKVTGELQEYEGELEIIGEELIR